MNAKEFYNKVKEMRHAQKEYFRTRNAIWLSAARQREREIDNEIARVEDASKPRQTEFNLFTTTLVN